MKRTFHTSNGGEDSNMAFRNILVCSASVAAIYAAAVPGSAHAQEVTRQYNIPSQPMAAALRKLGEASQTQIAFSDEAVEGLQSNAVVGQYTTQAALKRMIGKTGLKVSLTPSGVITVTPAKDKYASSVVDESGAVPEILVIGQSTLNADIRHSENEARPYVVLNAREIEESQATSVDEFLQLKLPQNNVSPGAGTSNTANPGSGINLRGLGVSNTLLLVDGRPAPRTFTGNGLGAQDINGIPLSSIERIEVLPASSGGLYGGNAIGGVVNVILKRDYSGLTITTGYQNTFKTNAPIVNLEVAGGFRFNEGRTRVSFSAAHKSGSPILVGDRSWTEQARATRLANAPGQYFNPTTPPLGSTPNIRSANGSPLVLLDGRTLNSNVTYVPLGYVAGDSLQGFIDNAGKYNLALADNALGARRALRTDPKTLSFALGIRQEVTDWLDLYLDGRRDINKGSALASGVPSSVRIAAGAPQNPFQQAIRVSFPVLGLDRKHRQEFVTSKISFGGIFKLSPEWSASLDLGWGQNKNKLVSTDSTVSFVGEQAIADGTVGPNGEAAINILQDPAAASIDFSPYLYPFDNQNTGPFIGTELNSTLRIGGPLPTAFGIKPVFAGGVDFKRSILNSTVTSNLVDFGEADPYYFYTYYPKRSQNAYSAFGNITLPLIEQGGGASWGDRAELSGTVRYDRVDVRTFGPEGIVGLESLDSPRPTTDYATITDDSAGYTIAALYGPTEDIFFRASLASGFIPPSMSGRIPKTINASVGEVADPNNWMNPEDPQRGYTEVGSEVPWQLITEGNPNLKPETSTTVSFGLVATPRWIPGLRFSVDYTDTKRKGEVNRFLFDTDILENEALYPGRIRREDRALTAEEVALGYTATPVVFLDTTPINMAKSRVRAIDFSADYIFNINNVGEFRFSSMVTRQINFSRQLTPGAPNVDYINWTGEPMEWRGNAGIDWKKGAFAAGFNLQYYNKYRVGRPLDSDTTRNATILAQGREYIPAQYYVDFTSTINLSKLSKDPGFQGMRFGFGIRNLFDAAPPLYIIQERTAPSGDALGRRFTVNLTKEF